jgi:hypothetical protein
MRRHRVAANEGPSAVVGSTIQTCSASMRAARIPRRKNRPRKRLDDRADRGFNARSASCWRAVGFGARGNLAGVGARIRSAAADAAASATSSLAEFAMRPDAGGRCFVGLTSLFAQNGPR